MSAKLRTTGLLGGLMLLFLGVFYGVLAGHFRWFPSSQVGGVWRRIQSIAQGESKAPLYGRWHKLERACAASAQRDAGASMGTDAVLLEDIGYAGAYEEAPEGAHGVLASSDLMQPGLTLFCSGHAPVVLLIDAEGQQLHSWQVSFDEAFRGQSMAGIEPEHKQFIRRAHVFPNGDLLALFEYSGMLKLDRHSKLIWSVLGGQHHDFTVLEDGSIVALNDELLSAEQVAERFPGLPSGTLLRDNAILFMDASGKTTGRSSILDGLYRSDYAQLAYGYLDHPKRDPIHANSVELISSMAQCWDERIQVGDVIVSSRNMNALFALRPSSGRVVWLASGRWRGQHQASVLANGNILLLDNQGGNKTSPYLRDRSRVMEWDPRRDAEVWSYSGSTEAPLFTHWLGFVQPLANGNVLITESSQGRLLEVTRTGALAWQYLSPFRAGEHGELIATLMGAQRIAAEALPFLEQ